MARAGLTYEEVELVAEKILQAGQTPTIERLRHELGTGSNSTISKHLNQWKSQRLRGPSDVLPTLKTPPDAVSVAVQRVWQQMEEENIAKIKAVEIVSEEKINNIQLEKEEAFKERDKYIEDNLSLSDFLKEEKLARNELEKNNLELKQILSVTQEKLNILQKAMDQQTNFSNNLLTELQQQQIILKESYKNNVELLTQQQDKALHDVKMANEDHRRTLLLEIDKYKNEVTEFKKILLQKDIIFDAFKITLNNLLENQMITQQNMDSLKNAIQHQEALINNNQKVLEMTIKTDLSQCFIPIIQKNQTEIVEYLKRLQTELKHLKDISQQRKMPVEV